MTSLQASLAKIPIELVTIIWEIDLEQNFCPQQK